MSVNPVNEDRFAWNGPGWYRFAQSSNAETNAVWYEDEQSWKDNAEWAREASNDGDFTRLVYLGDETLPDDGSCPAEWYFEEVDLWHELRREDEEDDE